MTDMKYLADALAYHTKGRKAVLEQIQEKKCSCCDADPCNCDDDCSCKKDVKEASIVNGKNMDGQKRWKTTSLSHADAVAQHGGENVKVTKGGLRNGDDHVQVYSEGQDLKNDKNANGIDDKDESEAKDNVVKKINAKADKKPVEEGKLAGNVRHVKSWIAKGHSREKAHELAKSDFYQIHPNTVDDLYNQNQKDDSVSEAASWIKDSGWKKPKEGPTKDKFGNEIKDKNRAKSLAKDAAKTSAKMDEEVGLDEAAYLKGDLNKRADAHEDQADHHNREAEKAHRAGDRLASTTHAAAARAHMKAAGVIDRHLEKPRHLRPDTAPTGSALAAHKATQRANALDEGILNKVEDELIEHALDLHEMIQDLNVLFIEQQLSLTEAFQAAAMTDDELEENFGKMSKTKRLIAAKKAALTKRKTGNWGGRRGTTAPPPQPKPLKPMR